MIALQDFTTDETVEFHMRQLKRSYELIQDFVNSEWERQKKLKQIQPSGLTALRMMKKCPLSIQDQIWEYVGIKETFEETVV